MAQFRTLDATEGCPVNGCATSIGVAGAAPICKSCAQETFTPSEINALFGDLQDERLERKALKKYSSLVDDVSEYAKLTPEELDALEQMTEYSDNQLSDF